MTPTPNSPIASSAQFKKSIQNENSYTNEAFDYSQEQLKQGNVFSEVKITNNVSNNNAEEANLDFDDVLPHLGEFGRYQIILFFSMIPFAFFVAFVYFTQIFITLVPDKHWCRIPEIENLTRTERYVINLIFYCPRSSLIVLDK